MGVGKSTIKMDRKNEVRTMRKVKVKKIDHNDLINLEDINHNYIYAGLSKVGEICIASKVQYEIDYFMQVFATGNSNQDGFTSGNHYSYIEKLNLKPMIKRFAEEHNTDIYEFRTIEEFAEWVLEVGKRRE